MMSFKSLSIVICLLHWSIQISYAQTEFQNFKVQYDSCRVRFNNGKYPEAANWLEANLPAAKLKQKEKIYWDMNNLLARCYVHEGKTRKAEGTFKETINFYNQKTNREKYHANHLSALVNMAYMYFGLKDYANADKYYYTALELKKEEVGEKNPDFLTLLNNVAVVYNLEGKNIKADSLYTKLANLRREVYGENNQEYINTIYYKANLYKNTGRYLEAEPLYNKVVAFRKIKPGENSPEFMFAYKHLGQLYVLQRRYTDAEPVFLQLVELNRAVYGEKHKEYTEAINNVGQLYISMERYAEAEKLFLQVIDIRKNTLGKSHIDNGSAYNNLAFLYRKMSKYINSEKFYKKALEIYETNVGRKHSSYVITMVNLASLYKEMGRFLDAENRYNRAKSIYEETIGNNSLEFAGLLNNMALFYTDLGKYEKAESFYKESLSITEELHGVDHPDYATTLNNLASLYKTMGRYEEAEGIYLRSSNIRKQTLGENNYDYASSINNIGALYEIMGRYKEAEEYYKQSLEIIKRIFGIKHPVFANQLNNLAGLYEVTNDYEQAASLYTQALEIQSEVLGEKHPDYVATLNNLALLQQKTGNYKKAEELYKQNLAKTKANYGVEHPAYATSLSNLAGLYEAIAKYKEAEGLYLQALKIRKISLGELHPSYGSLLVNLGRIYAITNAHVKSDSMWFKATNISLHQIQKYFPSMSEKEKGEFYNTIRTNFEQFNSYGIIRAAKDPTILGKMYNNQLATKALLLNASNKLRHNILNSGDTILIEKFKTWLNQKEFLSKVYGMSKEDIATQKINVDSIEKATNYAERELSQKSELFKKTNEQSYYTWQDVRKQLKPGEAAMEILRFPKFKFDSAGIYTDSVFYAALIVKSNTQNYPELVLMREGAVMETKLLRYYRNAIKQQTDNEFCYRYFWNEISTKLAGLNKVYISPDGSYNQININTLQNLKTKKFVFDEIEVQIVSNTKDLIQRKVDLTPIKDIVLFGNPDFLYRPTKSGVARGTFVRKYKATLAPLPGTEMEVKEIDQIAIQNTWTEKLFTGDKVTEERVKSVKNPKVLHIATHGFFENDVNGLRRGKPNGVSENPLLKSGLMLAGSDITLQNKKNGYINSDDESQVEDGILTAYEAMNMNLENTDVVVLSACETGLGEVKNGEGVYGLQRSFQVAGSRSIVNSLWTVNDETTMLLMTNFYREWMKTNDKKKAFRTAQSLVRQKYPNPYYWGAFVMIGD
jgi:CHAT domain-containing protein/Flp pilus assembly protein TadD